MQGNPMRSAWRIALATLLACHGALPRLVEGADRWFAGGEPVKLAALPTALAVDDFDGDRALDVVVVHGTAALASVLLDRPGGLFEDPVTFQVGLSPVFVVTGDLDRSGRVDIVVVNLGSSTLSVLMNRGDGSFAAPRHVDVEGSPRTAALADVDGDAVLDAVTSNFGSLDVSVLLGDGTGGFRRMFRLGLADNPHAVAADDLDGDGLADIAVAHAGTSFAGVTIFRSRGGGEFEEGMDFSTEEPHWLVMGDLAGDARLDVAILGSRGGIHVLENRGPRDFITRPVMDRPDGPGILGIQFLLAEDFDGDGRLDLITRSENLGNHGIRVHRRGAAEGFTEADDLFLDTSLSAFVLADMDGDSVLDAVAARETSQELALIHGLAPGVLDVRDTIQLPDGPRDLLLLDVDRDGAKDLLALSARDLHVVRLGPGGREPPVTHELLRASLEDMTSGDFDGDGAQELTIADLAGGKVVIASLDPTGAPVRTRDLETDGLPSRLAAGDFDGDSIDDVAVMDLASPDIVVHLSGAGNAGPVKVPAGARQTAIEAGDVDADGSLDLAVSSSEATRVLFGDGKGRFPRERSLQPAIAPDLRLADVDGDGRVDLIASTGSMVNVILNAASADPRTVEVSFSSQVRAVEAEDLDGDGLLEILALSSVPAGSVLVSRAAPGPVFLAPERYWVGAAPRAFLVADVDGDGRRDCVTADLGSKGLSILEGRGPSTPSFRRGDVDGDGRAGLADAVQVLSSLFLGAGPLGCEDAGDADDDGALALTDAVFLLLHLFAGGSPPPAPGAQDCGPDPTGDALGPCAGRCS
jgi:hypothetical protein